MKINLKLAALLLLIEAMLTPTQAMRIFFPQYSEKQLQEMKDHARDAAYKLRTDVPADVLKKAKKAKAIIHGNWISGDGLAWDLQGNDLLPGVEFTEIRRFNDSLYAIRKTYDSNSWGIVNSRGKEVVPCEFREFSKSYLNFGLINATTGVGAAKSAVYTTDGRCVLTVPVRLVNPMQIFYRSEPDFFVVEHTNGGNFSCDIYLSDGTPLVMGKACSSTNVIYGKGYIQFGSERMEWTKPAGLPHFEGPGIPALREADLRDIESNPWYHLFVDYFSRHDYKTALTCAEFFDIYEDEALCSFWNCQPIYTMTIGRLECLYNLGRHDLLRDIFSMRLLDLKIEGRGLVVDVNAPYSTYPDVYPDAVPYVDVVNAMKQRNLSAIAERAARQQRILEMWGNILQGASASIQQTMASMPSASSSASYNSAGTSPSMSSVAGSTSSSSDVEEPETASKSDNRAELKKLQRQLKETEDALDRHLAHMAKKKADHETGGWATEYSLKESYEKRIAFLKQQIADLSK